MSRALATVIFGLAASLCWGSGDFSGGLASRRANASSVVLAAYAVGFVLLTALALIWREPLPGSFDVMWGALAGLAGAVGLIAFYTALSIGNMGIAAPLSAMLTAGLPVIFAAFTTGLPNPFQIGGFILALLAIGLISRPERATGRPKGIGLALVAGCGFGCFFILISRVSHGETFWPLAVARLTSVLLLLVIGLIRRQRVQPAILTMPLVLCAGTLDAIGNAFFVLATHSGRLDVAAILSSLYPAATVLLAVLVLRERVSRIQTVGILLALLAVPLISV
ncbi:MAG TPA: DMT family transporter [Ktedonobacteraceae bacterium]|jgi:drug/metabolite transporter (DMT)-like permease|nr:DMT family transporter [Ktedonobacteraceae bacterium]